MTPLAAGLWASFGHSLLIAVPATALAAAVGVPAAYVAARRRFALKPVLEMAVLVPLVLPPTVVGYLLVILLGRNGPLGRPLAGALDGYSVLFTPAGGVIAAAIVALPLLYLPSKAAFGAIEREAEDVARLNGASTWQVFWLVSLPMAGRGVLSGLILAFARALGEFGATVMVMGKIDNRPMTLPVLVYDLWEQGETGAAVGPVILLCLVALLLVAAFNWKRE